MATRWPASCFLRWPDTSLIPGGITDNTPRMLPESLAAAIEVSSWPVPPIFRMLRDIGDVPEEDWRRTLNLGIGMILAVGEKDAVRAERILRKMNEPHH